MNLNIKKGDYEVNVSMNSEKEDQTTIHPDNLKKIDAANPENPFEEVGELHDYAMKRIFLIPNVRTFNESSVLEQLSDILQKYPIQSKFLKNIKKYDLREVAEELSGTTSKIYNPNTLYPPTPEQKEYLSPFLQELVFWMYNRVSNFDKTKESLNDYVREAIAYEKKLMESDLGKEIKNGALISMAIMRRSSITYLEHFNKETGDETVIHAKKKCECKKVARVAIDDGIGALSGMAGGAIGVIVGAIIASGRRLIKELDNPPA